MSIKLQDILPSPSSNNDDSGWVSKDPWFRKHDAVVPANAFEPPPYGQRDGFVPKKAPDFGDGGAFPEIPIAQFPLDMGKGGNRAASGSTLALQVDQDGKVQYDAIVKVGASKDKVVYTKLGDTRRKFVDESDPAVQKPDDEAVAETTQKTRAALEKITNAKISSSLPVQLAEKTGPAQYIRYTPSQQNAMLAAGSEQRLIRMVEEQKDPMEPPRFKINQKIPPPPPSPPAPVMHSPPRKVTTKEQQDWKIPPCISNWKNPKGYTIPLDKRLAADGRGLQQVHINENFSKLAEALYIADRKAREAVEARSQLEKRLAQKKKEEQEEQMREMARKAREERQGIRPSDKDDEEKKRDEFRRDRQNERRRERNIERMKPEKIQKQKAMQERDISEKIALGIADPGRGTGEGVQFDERLFNQSQGMDSGAADDGSYAIYDKPWRPQDNVAKNIYRPTKNADSDIYGADLDKIINTQRFVPDKGFSGADTSSKRDGPVQFEKSDADPFGLGDLLESAKKGSKRKGEESKRDDEKRKR